MPDGAIDTVAAIATASAHSAGIGVVRISGSRTREIAQRLFGKLPQARYAALRDFRDCDGAIIDQGLVLFFPAPGSYTGEDVVELHAHGGLAVLDLLLSAVIDLGARRARPGEFTERAFLNGRMDLLQAEAVADLIDAASSQAARAAQATLRGDFSDRIGRLTDALTSIRVHVEAGFDFSEEELGEAHTRTLLFDLRELSAAVDALFEVAARGVRLRDGLRVVLVGSPNVGKSSVLNRLAGQQRAIVTPIPGTTRDVIRENIQLDGVTIELMDTAGLHDSDDAVEKLGMARTTDSARHADLVLLLCDDSDRHAVSLQQVDTDGDVLVVRNKVDLTATKPGYYDDALAVSALTGAGFDELRFELRRRAASSSGCGEFSARQRHLDCLGEAREHLHRALEAVKAGHESELCAEDLRLCQVSLGQITGTVTSDDLLGEIFSSFCIGK